MKDDDNSAVELQLQQLYRQRKSVHPLPESVKQQLHKAAVDQLPRQKFWLWTSLGGGSVAAAALLFLVLLLPSQDLLTPSPEASIADDQTNQRTLSRQANSTEQHIVEYQLEMALKHSANETAAYVGNDATPAATPPPAARFDNSAVSSSPSPINDLGTVSPISSEDLDSVSIVGLGVGESIVTAKLAAKQDDRLNVKLIDCQDKVHLVPKQQLSGFESGQWVKLYFDQTHQLQRVEAVKDFKGC